VTEKSESRATQLVNWLIDHAVDGVPPLSSAEALAREYLSDPAYTNNTARIEALIKWESSKNFAAGFLTGLGGVLTMPVTVPGSLAATWVIQARMAAAIALIHGHDLRSDRVRTFVMLAILGDSAKEVLKDVGLRFGMKAAEKAILRIPGRLLAEVNRRVGFRLLSRASGRGLVTLVRVVPVAGGLVGGGLDAFSCRAVGRFAHKLFARDLPEPRPTPLIEEGIDAEVIEGEE
jgi:uncharacterized protein (DUF697 family)